MVLLLLAIVTAIAVSLHRPAARADLTIWTFSPLDVNPNAVDAFERRTGKSVAIELIGDRALDTRLLSQFASGEADGDVPDLVEIEIGSIGKFFRPPVDRIGFLPLNQPLRDSGLGNRLLAARLVPWSKDGVVFGLPQDVHPVTLTYRRDLFDAAGIDPAKCRTWADLHAACEAFNRYWSEHGQPEHGQPEHGRANPRRTDRLAMMLSSTAADDLIVMLQQRHVQLLDAGNGVHLAEPIVARTVLEYASMVTGDRAIAGAASPGEMQWTHDVERGDLCMLFTPDWRARQLKAMSPSLAGRLAMMPLPVFDPADAPTGSWGGTMIGIPRGGKHARLAWDLAAALTLDPPPDAIPALPARWSDAQYHQPDPFFDGQSIDGLYVRLAAQLPPRVITSFSALADTELADVLRKAVQLQRDHPERTADDPRSLTACLDWLRTASGDLQARIRLATF